MSTATLRDLFKRYRETQRRVLFAEWSAQDLAEQDQILANDLRPGRGEPRELRKPDGTVEVFFLSLEERQECWRRTFQETLDSVGGLGVNDRIRASIADKRDNIRMAA